MLICSPYSYQNWLNQLVLRWGIKTVIIKIINSEGQLPVLVHSSLTVTVTFSFCLDQHTFAQWPIFLRELHSVFLAKYLKWLCNLPPTNQYCFSVAAVTGTEFVCKEAVQSWNWGIFSVDKVALTCVTAFVLYSKLDWAYSSTLVVSQAWLRVSSCLSSKYCYITWDVSS